MDPATTGLLIFAAASIAGAAATLGLIKIYNHFFDRY
jgi:hypothetical protein